MLTGLRIFNFLSKSHFLQWKLPKVVIGEQEATTLCPFMHAKSEFWAYGIKYSICVQKYHFLHLHIKYQFLGDLPDQQCGIFCQKAISCAEIDRFWCLQDLKYWISFPKSNFLQWKWPKFGIWKQETTISWPFWYAKRAQNYQWYNHFLHLHTGWLTATVKSFDLVIMCQCCQN